MAKSKQVQVFQKEIEEFRIHELVFVKTKGSCLWPSRINAIDGKFVVVLFLGDGRRV